MFRALSGDGQEIHLSCEEVGNDEVYLITYGRKLQTNNFPYDTSVLSWSRAKSTASPSCAMTRSTTEVKTRRITAA